MRSTSRRFRRGAIAAGAATATLLGGLAAALPANATPVATAAASSSATQAVIVVLRDQVPSAPADKAHVATRSSRTSSAQQAVLGRLAGARPTKVTHYVTGNAFAATVTAAQAAALAADPAVASVVPDTTVSVAPPASAGSAGGAGAVGSAPKAAAKAAPKGQAGASRSAAEAPAAATPSPVSPQACSTDPAKPKLEPEALQTMNVRSDDPRARTAAALGIDGSGVKVAFIADGINPANKAFIRKNGKSAIVDYKDFYGDGPNAPTSGAEAFGDASSIAAQGNVVYDVADFANPKVVTFPGGHCYIRVAGVAPGASVVALKAGSELLPNSAILQAIDYAVRVSHVDVLNESFGGDIAPDYGARNTIQLFNDQAVHAGVTVTVSTGDAGVTSTIGSPSTDPLVISSAATTDSRIYEQTGYALAARFGNGRWQSDNISALSSSGVTHYGRTVDLSAPGEADWAACDSSTTTIGGEVVPRFSGCTSFRGTLSDIQPFGGTSQSAPLTAGTAALVIQAYRKTHGGASPTPALVKKILTSTTRDLGFPGDEQGTGRIDARAAVEAALTYPKAKGKIPAGVSSNIALSTDQLTLEGHPGSTVTGRVTVTNVGTRTLRVAPTTRQFADIAVENKTVAINATTGETTPYPTTAAPWVFTKVTFVVPPGADRLASSFTWGAQKAGQAVRLSLFAPDGTYAANSRPQGGPQSANYGFVDVRRPAAGTWTAVFYTVGGTGYTGNIAFEAAAQRAIPVGTVTPHVASVKPGRSTVVTVRLPVRRVGGDDVYTVSIGSSGGHQTAVPVVVRAVIPTTGKGAGAFAGTITGGNARGSRAQQFSFAVDVPKGKRDLDVSTILSKDPGTLVQTILIDPNGETPSVGSNQTIAPGGTTLGQGTTAQNYVANPVAGRWIFVVAVQTPATGNQLRLSFNGRVAFDRVKVSAPGLPNSAAVKLPAGKPVTLKLTFTNTGVEYLPVQTDARLEKLVEAQLAPQFGSSTIALPFSVDDFASLPGYLVPPGTKSVSLTSSSTVPAQVELSSPLGGIDVFGDLRQAQGGSTVSTATVSERNGFVGHGIWFPYVQQIGPFGDGGAPAGTALLSASALTKAFDPAVSTSTGDPFLSALDPTADAGTPAIVAPGASTTITVTVTPTGAKGSVVHGEINLVTTLVGVNNTFNTTGDVIATVPYTYTVS